MSQAFIKLDRQVAEWAEHRVLITPNERLAREYQLGLAQHQQHHGLTGWITPKCVSLQRWLVDEFERAAELGLHQKRLLSQIQLLQAVMRSAPDSLHHLCEQIMHSWQLVQRFDIDLDDVRLNGESTRSFRAWLQRLHTELPSDAVAPEVLPQFLQDLQLIPTQSLVLIDIDRLSPAESRYMQMVAAQIDVDSISGLDSTISEPLLCAAENLDQELAAAAHWARHIKQQHADARIGIVVPTLLNDYHRVLRHVGAALDPLQGSLSGTFDVSGGQPLREHAVWRHADLWLSSHTQTLTPEQWATLAHSPFLQLNELSDLLLHWPEALPKYVGFRSLQDWLSETSLYQTFSLDLSGQKTLADWVSIIRSALSQVGWPNTSDLNSTAYQAAQAVQHILSECEADDGHWKMPWATASKLIDLRLGQHTFAIERPHSDIQVLGQLETSGLSFTHLWVIGLDEHRFPQPLTAHPFIPNTLANTYGVPRSTVQAEREFAEQQLLQWQKQTDELVISFTAYAEDATQGPSALLANLQPQSIAPQPYHPLIDSAQLQTEPWSDESGEPLVAANSKGGVGLLKDYANCPMRAYANYRLDLRAAREPMNFPDALQRGILVHDVLHRLVERYRTSEVLAEVTRDDIAAIVQRVLRRYQKRWPSLFLRYEAQRLVEQTLMWLKLEQQRAPFKNVYVEQSFQLDVAGLTINIRVDRVDQQGEYLYVLDYKTGNVKVSDAAGEPLKDPQLPVYSQIPLPREIYGVYYAQIKNDHAALKGIAHPVDNLQPASQQPLGQDWQAQQQTWRSQLERIAQGVIAGRADIKPLAEACRYCHLHNFCRIREQP